MKASDIFMAKEPLEMPKGGFILGASANRLFGVCGEDSCNWPYESFDKDSSVTPTIRAFIQEAKAYFTPKKSCGDLTMEDLQQLMLEPVVGSVEHWALSRRIQLPEEK